MLEASCGLELSEWVLTEHRNPEETKEGMASASPKDASSSGLSTESVRIESRPCTKSLTAWSNNEQSSQPNRLVLILCP